MNNICDLLEVEKKIAHYLLVLSNRLFEAALNRGAFTVTCLLHEALGETQAAPSRLRRGAVRPPGHLWEPLPAARRYLGSLAQLPTF